MDWGALADKRPAKIRFWRSSAESWVRHRNPFLDPTLGMSLTDSHVVDTMHCWCLGIYQQFLAKLFWKIIKGGVFTRTSGTARVAAEMADQKAMQELNKHLTSWYSKFAKENPKVVLTRMHDMSLDTLGGSEGKMLLRAKAHETLCLLRYVALHMPIWQESVENGEKWAKGAALLWHLWSVLEESGPVVPAETQEARHREPHTNMYIDLSMISETSMILMGKTTLLQ